MLHASLSFSCQFVFEKILKDFFCIFLYENIEPPYCGYVIPLGSWLEQTNCGLTLSPGIMIWTNLSINKFKLFWLIDFWEHLKTIIFFSIYSFVKINHPLPIVAPHYHRDNLLKNLNSHYLMMLSHKLKLFWPNNFLEEDF